MKARTDNTKVKFSDEASVRASFADYIKNNEIDRQKLLEAVNACELVRDNKGGKLTLSFDDLNLVLADIDKEIESTYKVSLEDADAAIEKYAFSSTNTSNTPLTNSQKLIYASLLLYFDLKFQTHPEMMKIFARLDELSGLKSSQNNDEMRELMGKMESLRHHATVLFGQELHKTDAKIQAAQELHQTDMKDPETIFTKIDNFFSTPSLARDLVVGVGVGLLAAGGVAGFILLTVGTAGIGPLVLGTTAAAALGTAAATGLSLGAIGLGVAGVITAFFAGVGALLRSETPDNSEKQTISLDSPQEPIKNQFSGLLDKTSKAKKSPIVIPNSDSIPTSAPQRELSEIERLSKQAMNALNKLNVLNEQNTNLDSNEQLSKDALEKLDQLRIANAMNPIDGNQGIEVAVDYIGRIYSGNEIKESLEGIKEIIEKIPKTCPTREILNDYVVAIGKQLPPEESPRP